MDQTTISGRSLKDEWVRYESRLDTWYDKFKPFMSNFNLSFLIYFQKDHNTR